jgi:hypothetical protein
MTLDEHKAHLAEAIERATAMCRKTAWIVAYCRRYIAQYQLPLSVGVVNDDIVVQDTE